MEKSHSTLPFYKSYLKEELAKRCANNPAYSLRAFAKSLGVDPASLSRTLANKQPIATRTVDRMLRHLDMSADECYQFEVSAKEDQRPTSLPTKFRSSAGNKEPVQEIGADLFKMISEIHHYAILELTYVEGFKSDAQWIARTLGLSLAETKLAIERLLSLGLLAWDADKLIKTQKNITTKNKQKSSVALRSHQKQIIGKALAALDKYPIERRQTSSYTLAIDPQMLPDAKQMVEEFIMSIDRYFNQGKPKEVYQLNINFFPLQD